MFQEAQREALEQLKNDWLSEESADKRNALWHEAKAIHAVERQLRIIRDNGLVAARERNK